VKRRGYPILEGERDRNLPEGPLKKAIVEATTFLEPSLTLYANCIDLKTAASVGRCRLVVRCSAPACGRELAQVWATPFGLLFRGAYVRPHELWQSLEDAVLMVHPDLPGQVAEVARRSLERVWVTEGWREAPPGTDPPKRFRPQYGILTHDLLDFESDDHPSLVVRCRRHPAAVALDRERLLERTRQATGPAISVPTHEVSAALT
jgi:hypothetical protein